MAAYKEVELSIPGLESPLKLDTFSDNELVSSMIQRDRIWEAYETQLLVEYLKPGDRFLDVGANIGYYTLLASQLVGNKGRVLAFEPDQENFRLLTRNVEKNNLKNVATFNAGLGDKDKTITLFINPENRGDHRAFANESANTQKQVKILRGDEQSPEKINFIKIDTQGYELNIIKGLSGSIGRNQQNLKMIVEFWPYALEQNGSNAKALIDELKQYSFNVKIIDHIKHKLIDTDWSALLTYADQYLDTTNKGFINLWLEGG